MSSFLKLLKMDVREHTKRIEGFAYLPWALALSMAGRPAHETVMFKVNGQDSAARKLFRGAAVAVDMDLGDGSGSMQRIYLPVLNMKNAAINWSEVNSRDVSDTISRCVARAVAMVHGYGLSLYSLTEGDGAQYVEALGVTPDTADLSQVRELRDRKEFKDKATGKVRRTQEYLGWHAALAACRITDPSFRWEVVECEVANPSSGEPITIPAMPAAGKGWVVGVRLYYKGKMHTQWLPIMGVRKVMTRNGEKPMEHQPIDDPDVFEWHSAVMRCLAKGIAIATGYGIACYAGEHAAPSGQEAYEEEGLLSEPPPKPAPSRGRQQSRERPKPEPTSPSNAGEGGASRTKLLSKIDQLMKRTSTEKSKFEIWLGVRLDEAAESVLERGVQALEQKAQNHGVTTH